MRRKQVEAQTGLARSTLYKLIAHGEFPPPIRIMPDKEQPRAESARDLWR